MSPDVDRRKFLKYSGAAGAATGAAWVAPSVLGSSTAFAAGSCVKSDQVKWTDFVDNDLAWSSGTFTTQLPVHRYVGTGTPTYTVKMDVTPVGTSSMASHSAHVSNGHGYDAQTAVYLLEMAGVSSPTVPYGWDVTFTWPTAFTAYRLNFNIGDIDEDEQPPDQSIDHVHLTPPLTVPPDSYGFTPGFVTGFGTSASPWTGANGPQNDSTLAGQVSVAYSISTANTVVTVHYRGDQTTAGANQTIGFTNLTWCL